MEIKMNKERYSWQEFKKEFGEGYFTQEQLWLSNLVALVLPHEKEIEKTGYTKDTESLFNAAMIGINLLRKSQKNVFWGLILKTIYFLNKRNIFLDFEDGRWKSK